MYGQGFWKKRGNSTRSFTITQTSPACCSITEGNTGTPTVTYTVTLSGPIGVSSSVSYSTSNGTATAGTDYTAVSGTLSFLAGETTKTFTVTLIPDTRDEPNETFRVSLSSPAGGPVLGSPSFIDTTIADDDPTPTVRLAQTSPAPPNFENNSGTSLITYTVTLSAASDYTITVNYSTANGTATAGSDYNSSSGTLTFSPGGSLTRTFTVGIIGDTVYEPDESFTVSLSSPVNATLGSPSSVTTTISNDDACVGNCEVGFAFSGSNVSYKLPASCSSITVKAWGAGAKSGGAGGYATATIPVTGGETLTIIVGERGCDGNMGCSSYPNATFGGGGAVSGATSRVTGGGRSAVRRSTTELITAGGGGGATSGGAGGGSEGQKGNVVGGGYGGTQTAGGVKDPLCTYNPADATNGSQFQGGNGSSSSAGGGGWYGGAGGCDYGPGGGGSSYVPAGGSTIGGSGTTPGNSADTHRNGAGNGGTTPSHGRVVLIYNCL
jgi:hypothetical protein